MIALDQCGTFTNAQKDCMWRLIGSFAGLMVAVANHDGLHAPEFPCRFSDGCWIEAKTGRLIEVHPTYWREWPSD
jgi:hypothetical protein